ncbi:PDZ domain-containing protein [Schaalia suimastitidis]|uniref:YlbL family protein n=1 Tax=Schaalia suimastitidis TaxID=121163 RepID=UPI0003FB8269|nr:S16 family serine protease [Schaalia suimastitidis]
MAQYHDDDTATLRPKRRIATGIIAWSGVVAIGLALTLIPVPFVVESPGPTVDVGGSLGGNPILDISGTDPQTGDALTLDPLHEAGDASGQIRLVTVSESGGPGHSLSTVELFLKWLDSRNTIHRYSDIYGPDVTSDDVTAAGQAQMSNAQSASTVAALEELGWDVPATIKVVGVVEGSHAVGKLMEGDVLVSITTPDGTVHQVDSPSVPFRVMKSVAPESQLNVTVVRNGETVTVDVTSIGTVGADGQPEEGSKLGLYLEPEATLPIEVGIELENIMGPSAGMVFALGIIDRLTAGDMTGGQVIAGTGTLTFDGEVGAIGGIKQKMWGAVRDGATWFLAPQDNCSDVVGNVPEGLRVVSVGTLSEARAAVDAIAQGSGEALPTCQSVQG